MTTKEKKKEVLLEEGRIRIVRLDRFSCSLEIYERYYNPKKKEYLEGWRFKGYVGTVLGGLQLVVKNELLTGTKEGKTISEAVKSIESSNSKVMKLIESLMKENK